MGLDKTGGHTPYSSGSTQQQQNEGWPLQLDKTRRNTSTAALETTAEAITTGPAVAQVERTR